MATNKTIPGEIPLGIGVDVIDRLARFDRSNFAADYAIGNQPWLAAPNDQAPITRLTTQYQKERVDQEASAGENSLSNWWLRSATSWHRGAGATFYDGDAEDVFRFRESANVDVWTQGQISLLKATEVLVADGAVSLENCASGLWWIDANRDVWLYRVSDGTTNQITGVTSDAYALTTDGCSALVATADGVWEVAAATLSATQLYTAPGGSWTPHVIGYVKDRIIAGAQVTDPLPMRIVEVGRNPATTPTAIDLAADSRYEYKSTSMSFVSVAETTGAILVATTTGNKSRVLSFTVDTSATGLAALLEPINVAEFPSGETVNKLSGYLSTFVVAATSRGLRVAVETSNGLGFTYGPLTIEGAVADFSVNGEYIYATRTDEFLGAQGLWRVHLGTTVGDVYAYASDLSIPVGTPVACAPVGSTGRMAIATSSAIYVESESDLAEAGYVDSGWVRFGTTEYKQPVSFSVRSSGDNGTLGVRVIDPSSGSADFESVPQGQVLNVPLSANLLPETEFEVRVTLSRDATDATSGPVLQEWQLRSLPAPLRSRTITIPLLCFSEEKDSLGNVRTADAWERLRSLESLEQTGGACLLQDFSTGEERICVVRAVQFEQSSPPSFVDGFGGIVTVQLQTVDVEIA